MKNVYLVNFAGVGNGIMTMPVIKFLIENKKYGKVFCSANGIIKNPEFNKIAKVKDKLFSVDPIWRRFSKSDWVKINDFLQENNISDIYNFRNENLEEYEEFKKKFPKYNYFDLNYKKLKTRKFKETVFNDIFSFFKKTGFKNTKATCEWLSKFRKNDNNKTLRIGFMVSASQMNKELHYEKWVVLARLLLKKYKKISIEIFSGISDEEIQDASRIVNFIDNNKCKFVGKLDLIETAEKLGRLNCLASNDTGLIHMAGAIGIPTVGVYVSTDPEVWGINSFVKHYFVKSSTVGKCENWKYYAGTCDHFYDICSETTREDIRAKDIFEKIQLVTKSSLSLSLVYLRLKHYFQHR
jgi:ADP-heptose:LPS heptosyltransferase